MEQRPVRTVLSTLTMSLSQWGCLKDKAPKSPGVYFLTEMFSKQAHCWHRTVVVKENQEINYQMRMRRTVFLIVPSVEVNFRGKYLVTYLAVL